MDTNTKGSWGELLVVADLLKRGYEVFKAVSPSATCDCIAMLEGVLLRIEVRCAHQKANGAWCVPMPHRERFDHCAVVLPTGDIHYDPPLDEIQTIHFHGITTFTTTATFTD